MSLFIGNLSKSVTFNDIKDEFSAIGPCKIQKKVSAFLITWKLEILKNVN